MAVNVLVQDVRFGVRSLTRHAGFTAAVVLTLALATGATTAIFGIVNSVLLRPLPFDDPERLVQVRALHPRTSAIDPVDLAEFRARSTSFDALAGYWPTTRHLQGPAGPERLTVIVAERALFPLLGVAAAVGRPFGPGDPLEVAVISDALWQRRFDRDPGIAGKTMTLDGTTVAILGVMPAAFQFPYSAASMMPGALPEGRTDVWVPSDLPVQGRVSYVAGRLKAGISLEAPAAELSLMAMRRQGQSPETTGIGLSRMVDVVVSPVRQSLWLLFAAVGLVLLAACANVASLLLVRTAARTREVAIRAAVGAGRLRVVRLVLVESLLLSMAGGLAGLMLARWGTQALIAFGAGRIPRAHEVALDWSVFAFLLIACLATSLLCGLAPALTAARTDVQAAMRESGGQATMTRGASRLRDGLVVAEVALAFVLAVGAAMVMRELDRLQRIPIGMDTANTMALHLTPRAPAGDYGAIEARVRQLPGVQAAGFIQLVPLQNWGWEADFAIRGRPLEAPGRQPVAGLRYVTPGYFAALGIPVVSGRGFTDGDHDKAPRVILVNQALARKYFAGEDPIGRDTTRGTIVGVVGDVRSVAPGRPADPELYYPAAQNVTMASDIGMSLIVRGTASPSTLVEPVRGAVRAVNPGLAVFNVKTMDQVVADSLWELHLYRWVVGLFAMLALTLAAIGLYSVTAYAATARTREFAIRMALGSDQRALVGTVLGRGLWMTAIGLVAGAAAAFAAARLLGEFGAGQADPLTWVVVGALLIALSLLAAAVPALRVATLNPVAALRQD